MAVPLFVGYNGGYGSTALGPQYGNGAMKGPKQCKAIHIPR